MVCVLRGSARVISRAAAWVRGASTCDAELLCKRAVSRLRNDVARMIVSLGMAEDTAAQRLISALGQKRTCAVQRPCPLYTPEADIGRGA